MSHLPVIVGFGGINAAGRSSHHHAFQRIVHEALAPSQRDGMLQSLRVLTGRAEAPEDELLTHTLTRKIDWRVADSGFDVGQARVNAGAQLPAGFDPATRYASHHHPRGLQMAMYAATDAIRSIGVDWGVISGCVPADKISLYASSAMGQLDDAGTGGMLKSALRDKRVTAKNCPLGLADMPADFVNAYILANLGGTGGMLGACATFLFNLEKASSDIQAGRALVAVVGAAEAPILPEIVEGYRAMSALADDEGLCKLDSISVGDPDYRRACRPFGRNCGFVLGESAQYLVLMADSLAIELGATVFGGVGGVFVNADGIKKSISAPGVGNYFTLARACGLARAIIGDDDLANASLLHSHGTGTPQNCLTETDVFDRVACAFGIKNWPVAAIKAYVGHSLGAAGGDQIAFALGSFATGLIPGISTVNEFSNTIARSRLQLSKSHCEYDNGCLKAIFINSKGFGGNNATALLLSPDITSTLIRKRNGGSAWVNWQSRNEMVLECQHQREAALLKKDESAIYRFGEPVMTADNLDISKSRIRIRGHKHTVLLDASNPFL